VLPVRFDVPLHIKIIPVTGREMLRIKHCLDNRFTDCGEVVRLTRQVLSTHRIISLIFISVSSA
jgi:hypothetical protein